MTGVLFAHFIMLFVAWIGSCSWVKRANRSGLSTQPCRTPYFWVRLEDVCFPNLTLWAQFWQKIQSSVPNSCVQAQTGIWTRACWQWTVWRTNWSGGRESWCTSRVFPGNRIRVNRSRENDIILPLSGTLAKIEPCSQRSFHFFPLLYSTLQTLFSEVQGN